MTTVFELVGEIRLDGADNVSKEIDKIKVNATGMTAVFGGAAVAIGNFAVKAADMILSKLGQAMDDVTVKASNMADEILDVAKATGLTTDQVQKFTLAANMEGKDVGTVSNMFRFYSKAMEDAKNETSKAEKEIQSIREEIAKGGDNLAELRVKLNAAEAATSEFSNAFTRLGIDFQSFSQLSTVAQMEMLFEAVNKITNANERAQVAMQLFGKSGMDSLDFINTYVTEGDKLDEISKKFAIPREDLESAAQLKATMGELQFIYDNMAIKIGSKLIPVFIKLEPLILKIADEFSKWLDNPENIAALENLINMVGKLVDSLMKAIDRWNSFPPIVQALFAGTGGIGMGLSMLGLASGGLVTQPTMAMVGEAGPEAVIPLNQMQNIGSRIITLNIGNYMGDEISKRSLVRDLQRILKEEDRRSNFKPTETKYYSVGGHL